MNWYRIEWVDTIRVTCLWFGSKTDAGWLGAMKVESCIFIVIIDIDYASYFKWVSERWSRITVVSFTAPDRKGLKVCVDKVYASCQGCDWWRYCRTSECGCCGLVKFSSFCFNADWLGGRKWTQLCLLSDDIGIAFIAHWNKK